MIFQGLNQWELEVLRILNGEDVPGWEAGAAMWACCGYLKSKGYAEGHYTITTKGRALLAAMIEQEGSSQSQPVLASNGQPEEGA